MKKTAPSVVLVDPDLLRRATEVFRSHGYANTSIQMLVDGTGSSRTSLYAAYGDKSGLFLAALQSYCDRQTDLTAMDKPTDAVWRATSDFERGINPPCLLTRCCAEIDELPEGAAEIVAAALAEQWTQLTSCAKRAGFDGVNALRESTMALVLRHGFATLAAGGLPGEELRAAAAMLLAK